MKGAGRALVSAVALAAGAGAAIAVGAGAQEPNGALTLRGDDGVAEARLATVVVVADEPGLDVITISGTELSGSTSPATPGKDFDAARHVVTLSGQEPSQAVTIGVVDDEADERTETFAVQACHGGKDRECNGSPDETRASKAITITDDDGSLDAAICGGLLRPLGVLLDRLRVSGAFEGCSP